MPSNDRNGSPSKREKRGIDWGPTLAAVGLGVLAFTGARRIKKRLDKVLPELRSATVITPITISSTTKYLARGLLSVVPPPVIPDTIRSSEKVIARAGSAGEPLRVRVFERAGSSGLRPAVLWMHGGGYVIGSPSEDTPALVKLLERLDAVFVSVDYRLAPEHPFPAPLDDCHEALKWLVANAATLGVDISRIAVGGQSAGGGLAAALVQRAVDQGPLKPAFQVLVYPMLDAATTTRKDHKGTGEILWNPKSNHYGWSSYLGTDPTTGSYPPYAVPAARADLANLPPAWIGVGTLDLFYEEDATYARRLKEAGVACELYEVEGAYHAFDALNPKADATARFDDSWLQALERTFTKAE